MKNILPEKLFITKDESGTRFLSFFHWFIIIIVFIAIISIIFVPKSIAGGDSLTYKEAIDVISGQQPSALFIPNRILTTFLPLELIFLSSKFFGNIKLGWILLNLLLYLISSIFFYKIILYISKKEKIAFISALFFSSNYAMFSFGLNYLMDIGGWAFYIFSIYFTTKYVYTDEKKDILKASLLVGVGALFKEYALLASVPIGVVIFWQNRKSFLGFVKNIWLPIVLSSIPLSLIYAYVYYKFNYTYLDWLGSNEITYVYSSRIIEYVKAFGSLLNLLGVLFILGLYVFIKDWDKIDNKVKLITVSIFLSFMPVFFWPAITQRILFISVPAVIVISSFFISKFEKYFNLYLMVLLLHFVINIFMDLYILKFVNLSFFF